MSQNIAAMTTATIGTADLDLGSAVAGLLTFAQSGIYDGQLVTYSILNGTQREVGRGFYSSTGPNLTRTTVLESTNGNAKINLSGTSEVYLTVAAEDLIQAVPSKMIHQVLMHNENKSQLGSGVTNMLFDTKGFCQGLATGTTAASAAYWGFLGNPQNAARSPRPVQENIRLSVWAYVSALADTTDDYSVEIGFSSMTAGAALGNNAFYFTYNRALYGDFWVCATRAGGATASTFTSAVAPPTSSQTASLLEIVYTSARVTFLINGVVVVSFTTNVPSVAQAAGLGGGARIVKSAGTASRVLFVECPTYQRIL